MYERCAWRSGSQSEYTTQLLSRSRYRLSGQSVYRIFFYLDCNHYCGTRVLSQCHASFIKLTLVRFPNRVIARYNTSSMNPVAD